MNVKPKSPRDRATDSAIKVLGGFFAEMHAWESRMLREDFRDLERLSPERIEAEVAKRRRRSREALKKIFEKYCDAGANAKRVRDVLHWGVDEPDYNADTERILSVTRKGEKVIVETQMAHNFKFRLRYELIRSNGKWRIRDNRKRWAVYDPKWSRWDL
jgi:hypothetical protein